MEDRESGFETFEGYRMASGLNAAELQRLARIGAQTRLQELRSEEQELRRAFPDLFRGSPGRVAGSSAVNGQDASQSRRGGMSAGQRKAVSERMRRYWAARRKAAGQASSATSDASSQGTVRRKSNISAAGRRVISERMKKYWAERRKQKATAKK